MDGLQHFPVTEDQSKGSLLCLLDLKMTTTITSSSESSNIQTFDASLSETIVKCSLSLLIVVGFSPLVFYTVFCMVGFVGGFVVGFFFTIMNLSAKNWALRMCTVVLRY